MHRIAITGLVLLVAACTGRPGNEESTGGAAGTTSPAQPSSSGATTSPSGAVGPGGMMGRDGMMGRGGMMGQGGTMGGRADTAAAPQARAAAATAPGCASVSQALVDQGRRIFTGVGNCYTCHGSNAQGTALAPNLTDSQWLNTDGSYGGIAGIVRNGVPRPKQHAAAMPPKGGAALAGGQVCAVAAYVYSLSHAGG